jgi:molybdopterin/thiamine biosynthesis adenylyltransferase/TusA-related sulfurtransferase
MMEQRSQSSKAEGLSDSQLKRYARNIVLPDVGGKGQRELLSSKVLIVGNGGLGSPCAYYLAAAGIGTIGLMDGDVADLSNLQRQILHWTSDIGKAKPESAKEKLSQLNPDVEIKTYHEWLNPENAVSIIKDYDVVVDATDNFPVRYLMNDVCVILGKPLVHGSIFQMEGQASVFWASKGPCYRCLYPAPPPPGAVPSCQEAGVLGSVAGLVGCIEATETIKILLGAGEPLIGRLLILSGLNMEFTAVSLKKNPSCPICGEDKKSGFDHVGWFEGEINPGSSDTVAEAMHEPVGDIAPEEILNSAEEDFAASDSGPDTDTLLSRRAKARTRRVKGSPGPVPPGDEITLDIKGDQCPMTYIKSRIAFDDLKVGDILKVLVDYEPASRNLPASFYLQGQEVLSVNRVPDEGWVVRIRKVK